MGRSYMLTTCIIYLVVTFLTNNNNYLQAEANTQGPNYQQPIVHPPSSQPRGFPAGPTAQPRVPMHGITEGSLQPQECSGRCSERCSATQYKKPCLFFCQKCCGKCLCVPPGTYGNKQFCPCYNNWKTKRGGPKCP